MDRNELERRFRSQPVDAQGMKKLTTIRDAFIELSVLIDDLVPDGREKSLAHTNLEDAAMWANKAITHTKS